MSQANHAQAIEESFIRLRPGGHILGCNGGNDQRIDGGYAVAGYGAGSDFRFR